MKRTLATLLTAAAATTALTFAVPTLAAADGPDCGPAARAQVRAQVAPQVAAFLAAHPDLAAELAKIHSLPKDQRKAERQTYRRDHAQELKDFRAVRQPLIDYRRACHRG
ncbi:hemophore-related protein [Nocardia pseudobrasiliensis]|uniref:Hemophore-related protein n=1 Tax=Nocardia pseudobrasiliensis TaxID=45979 RepID=A0A370IDA8_9NOCA|nr:hemophore-related protein [Nocardia pseudobrasiliensis]RDI68590.1 hemophore-related protein [Nocardia pseudobrasiliensis]